MTRPGLCAACGVAVREGPPKEIAGCLVSQLWRSPRPQGRQAKAGMEMAGAGEGAVRYGVRVDSQPPKPPRAVLNQRLDTILFSITASGLEVDSTQSPHNGVEITTVV